jgi:hypothetical protein
MFSIPIYKVNRSFVLHIYLHDCRCNDHQAYLHFLEEEEEQERSGFFVGEFLGA